MDKLILALAPAFAAGFAIQHLLEVLDPILFKQVKPARHNKKMVLGLISLLLGFGLACGGLRVLQPLGFTGSEFFDLLVTGLIISSGTEGVNSLVKFLGYTKEIKRAENKQMQDTSQDSPVNNKPVHVERASRRRIAAEAQPAAH